MALSLLERAIFRIQRRKQKLAHVRAARRGMAKYDPHAAKRARAYAKRVAREIEAELDKAPWK